MNDIRETAQQIILALSGAGVISEPEHWQAVPADGGLSHTVFLVGRTGHAPELTARLPMPGRGRRLTRQHALLKELGESCDCVPGSSLLVEDSNLREGMIFVQRFARGVPMGLDVVSNAARAGLAACLVCLHSQRRDYYTIWPELRPETGTRAQLFRERIQATTHHATFRGGLGHERQARITTLYNDLSSISLPDDAGWRFSAFAQLHGDLAIGNMIWNGDAVTLIDWEYTRAGDPAEDLAYLFAEQPVSRNVKSEFYNYYVEAGGDPNAIKRATWYAPLVALDSALWWGDYHLRHGNDPATAAEVLGFIEIAETHLRLIGPNCDMN